MIPNLSEEEKEYFDRWVKKSLRRHKRANTWKAIGPLIYLAATILFACAAIRACNEITWKPKPSDFRADSLYVDSVINGHADRVDTFPLKWGRAGNWIAIWHHGPAFDTAIAVETGTGKRDTAILNAQNPFN